MPYIFDPNLDKDKDAQQAMQGVQLSGASPVMGSTSGQAASRNQDVKSGSGFQNLDKYLSTNQSQQFGNQVLGKVGEQVSNAGNQMNTAGEQFKNQVQSSNALPTSQQINQAIADPFKADAKQFQGWQKQEYQGPKSLAESQDTWNRYWSGAKQAQTSAGLLGSEPGRFTLLDQYFGKPDYGFGQKSLDNLLVQQSGLGQKTRDLQNQATQLQTLGTQRAQELGNVAAQRRGEVEQNRNQVLSAIGLDEKGNVLTGANAGAIGKEWQNINDYLAQQNAARDAAQESFRSNLSRDTLAPEDIQALGIGDAAGTKLYDLDLSKYANYAGDLNKNQVMTPEQRARIQALSNLAGIEDTFASGLAEERGQNYGFDLNRLKADVGTRQGEFERAMKDTPVPIKSANGQVSSRPMSTIEAEIAATYADIARGNDTMAGRKFLAQAEPAVAQMKEKLANQFRTNRSLGTSPRIGAPSVIPPVGAPAFVR